MLPEMMQFEYTSFWRHFVLMTVADLSDADINTGNYPFGKIFRVVEEGRKAASSILSALLCPIEHGMDMSPYTVPPEGLPWFVNRCTCIVHTQIPDVAMDENGLLACRAWPWKSKLLMFHSENEAKDALIVIVRKTKKILCKCFGYDYITTTVSREAQNKRDH